MKELTREQKKIIYITAIICSSLLAFVIFVYLPQSRRLSVIRQQLKEAEANIADIGYITSGRDLNEAVKDLSAKLNLATKIIPSDKNDVIFNLTEAAKKIRLQVNSIDPQGEVKLEQSAGGYNLNELPIIIGLTGEFRAIGEFLNILRNNFPGLVKVKNFDINGDGEGRPMLTANLEIAVIIAQGK